MKIKTKQTSETTIEIPVPSFYKDNSWSSNKMLGILDEKTVVEVFENEMRTNVTNTDAEFCQKDIADAFANWQTITEDEFMTAHNRALHSLSLTPELSKTV